MSMTTTDFEDGARILQRLHQLMNGVLWINQTRPGRWESTAGRIIEWVAKFPSTPAVSVG